MLSGSRLKNICSRQKVGVEELAGHIAHGGFDRGSAVKALKNWQSGLYKPAPGSDDVEKIAEALGVEAGEISVWQASYRYAPMSASKVRLVTQLISGRDVQDALDILKFTNKRAAGMVMKLLQSAVANADEQEGDVENLYVCEARVDGAGRRVGTKAWIAKDRGRAHPICKQACHIHVAVAES